MAKESNPFSNFLESWGTDPEAEAKGHVYSATAQLKSGEAARMQDILAARQRVRDAQGMSPLVKDLALSTEHVNADNAMSGQGKFLGNEILSKPVVSDQDFNKANLFYGNTYSGGGKQQVVEVNGIPHVLNGTTLTPLMKSVTKTQPALTAGGANLNTTYTSDGKNVNSETIATPIHGAFNVSTADLVNVNKLRQASHLARNQAALKYPGGPYNFAINQKIGAIDGAGKATGVPPLNPLQSDAVIAIAKKFEAGGWMPDEAIDAALSYFPDINKSGGIVTKDFDNRGFGDSWFSFDDEKDALGNELPQLGGNAKYSATKNLNINNLGGLSAGEEPVPYNTLVAAQSDEGNLPTLLSGSAVRPQTATLLPSDLTLSQPGKIYHDGHGKFFVVEKDANGKLSSRQITGKNQ
jgi:hypothetical protein